MKPEELLREFLPRVGSITGSGRIHICIAAESAGDSDYVCRWTEGEGINEYFGLEKVFEKQSDFLKKTMARGNTVIVDGTTNSLPYEIKMIFNRSGAESLISMPVFIEDSFKGFIFLEHFVKDIKISQTELDEIANLARILVLSLENALNIRLLAQMKEKLGQAEAEAEWVKSRLKLKNEIIFKLSGLDNIDQMMEDSLAMLMKFFEVEQGAFYLLKEDRLEAIITKGPTGRSMWHTIPLPWEFQGVQALDMHTVIDEVERVLAVNFSCDDNYWTSIPLQAENSYLGSIILNSPDSDKLKKADPEFLEGLGAQIGVFIQNTISTDNLREYYFEMDQRVRQRTFELEALYELSREIGHSLDYGQLLESVLNTVNRVMQYDIASYILCIEQKGRFVIRVNSAIDKDLLSAYKSDILNRFLEMPSELMGSCPLAPTCIVRGVDYDDNLPPSEQKIQSTYYLPLKMDDKVVGVFNISSLHVNSFTDEHIRILNTIALQASISLTQLKQFIETRRTIFESILENIGSGVFVIDRDYFIKMSNSAANEMLKILAVTEEGNRIRSLGSFPIEELVNEILWGRAYVRKEEIVISGFTNYYYSVAISPYKASDNRIIGAIVVVQNITEEKVASQQLMQLARMISVGELAAGVAHEINNPLTGILGFSELLLHDPKIEKDVKPIIEDIYSAGKRAAQITEDLLLFAREQKEVQKQVILVTDLVNKTIKLVESQYAKLGITIIRNYENQKLSIFGSPGKMQQVILNLLSNAKDAMVSARKGNNIVVSIYKDKDGKVVVSVKDNGPGIPLAIRERIFDPFFTTKDVGKGTGLGLSITFRIVSDHQGKILVESEEGSYTHFKISIPGIQTDEDKDKGKKEEEAPLKEEFRILAVDDEVLILKFIQKYYQRLGYDVKTASTPHEGIKHVEKDYFDLVLIDFRMPEMNGQELYEKLIAIRPDIKENIIIVTGDVLGDEVKGFLQKTNARYLLKPMDLKDLRKLVERDS
ncbi:MAG: ATP-binding protein [Firmicutes bacterium]|nr:ATP-binding protein [Bacillota bacterium]